MQSSFVCSSIIQAIHDLLSGTYSVQKPQIKRPPFSNVPAANLTADCPVYSRIEPPPSSYFSKSSWIAFLRSTSGELTRWGRLVGCCWCTGCSTGVAQSLFINQVHGNDLSVSVYWCAANEDRPGCMQTSIHHSPAGFNGLLSDRQMDSRRSLTLSEVCLSAQSIYARKVVYKQIVGNSSTAETWSASQEHWC